MYTSTEEELVCVCAEGRKEFSLSPSIFFSLLVVCVVLSLYCVYLLPVYHACLGLYCFITQG